MRRQGWSDGRRRRTRIRTVADEQRRQGEALDSDGPARVDALGELQEQLAARADVRAPDL